MIQLQRIYDAPSETDGLRIPVDRLWPRGMTKKRAVVDVWPNAAVCESID
jgi:uncharacterized protein YeaO (DUF488 family)